VRLVERDDGAEVPELSDDLRVALADVAGAAREGLLAMSVGVGLRVMAEMMRDEVTAKVGPKHAKIPDRTANRHASAPGSVVLGARRVQVSRPRARSTDHEPVLPHPWRGRLFLTVRAGGWVLWGGGTLEIFGAPTLFVDRCAYPFWFCTSGIPGLDRCRTSSRSVRSCVLGGASRGRCRRVRRGDWRPFEWCN